MMIEVHLSINGHTAVVHAETADMLDVTLTKVVAAMKLLPYQYNTPSTTPFPPDWRPFNPNAPSPIVDPHYYGPGVVYCGGTPQQ